MIAHPFAARRRDFPLSRRTPRRPWRSAGIADAGDDGPRRRGLPRNDGPKTRPRRWTYYYSHDGLGSVRTLTDSSGVIENRYDYMPFGKPYEPGTSVAVGQRYTYTGREEEAASLLMYCRYRQYGPRLGRFTSRDPLMYLDGANMYAYAGSSPVRNTDPTGLSCEDECRGEGFSSNCRVAAVSIVTPGIAPDSDDNLQALAGSVDFVNDLYGSLSGASDMAQDWISTSMQHGIQAANALAGTQFAADNLLPGWPGASDFYDWGRAIISQRFGVDMYVTVEDDLCCLTCCESWFGEVLQFTLETGASQQYKCGGGRHPVMPNTSVNALGAYTNAAEAHNMLPVCIQEAKAEICVDRPDECP